MRRGEVWWANLGRAWSRRPVLLLSRAGAYQYLNSATAAPLTTRLRTTPSMVQLDPAIDHVPEPCIVNLDQLRNVRFTALTERITVLSPKRMAEVEDAIHFALGMRR